MSFIYLFSCAMKFYKHLLIGSLLSVPPQSKQQGITVLHLDVPVEIQSKPVFFNAVMIMLI